MTALALVASVLWVLVIGAIVWDTAGRPQRRTRTILLDDLVDAAPATVDDLLALVDAAPCCERHHPGGAS